MMGPDADSSVDVMSVFSSNDAGAAEGDIVVTDFQMPSCDHSLF